MTARNAALGHAGSLADTETRRVLKVCGATTLDDIELLAAAGADLVGLWHGVSGGRANLASEELAVLAAAAKATRRLQPVLVTFIKDAGVLRDVVQRTGIRWVQLHAYQTPAMVRALRAAVPGELTIVKVLHLHAGRCLERSLIRSYERAGTDLFLLDNVTGDGRIGSTGQQLCGSGVVDLFPALSRPFLLAGGISAYNRVDYDPVARHPLFFGIDVDTAARDDQGRLRSAIVSGITRGWRTTWYHEEAA
ncbi:MAG: phosphoribosylanthranilate isomerase [Pseudonocardiaceae bacterium]